MNINTNHILSVVIFLVVLYFVFTEVKRKV